MQNNVNHFDEKVLTSQAEIDRRKKKTQNNENRYRNKAITFRVTEEEKMQISQKINSSNLSQSEFIKQAILSAKITDPNLIISFRIQVKKIGNNINQIARFAHIKQDVSAEMIENLDLYIKELDEIWRKLKLSKPKAGEPDQP